MSNVTLNGGPGAVTNTTPMAASEAAQRQQAFERLAAALSKLPLAQDGKPGGYFVINGRAERTAPTAALTELNRDHFRLDIVRDDGKSTWMAKKTGGDETIAYMHLERPASVDELNNLALTIEAHLATLERGKANTGWQSR